MAVRPAADPLDEVLGRPAQPLLRAELDRRAAKMQVAVERLDVASAGPIGSPRDGSRDGDVLDERDDDDVLSG